MVKLILETDEEPEVKLTSLGMMGELAYVSSQGKISCFQFSGIKSKLNCFPETKGFLALLVERVD